MKHLVLLGGGHVHASFLQRAKSEKWNCRITCVSPSEYQFYSGMFSGFSEGLYEEADLTFSIEALCRRAGAEFLKAEAVRIDPLKKEVLLQTGGKLAFDLLSLNLGSESHSPFPGHPAVRSIKPAYTFPEKMRKFREADSPVIIGAGIAGLELALSVSAYRRKNGFLSNVTILSNSGIAPSAAENISKGLTRLLEENNIPLFLHQSAVSAKLQSIHTETSRIPFDSALILTGPAPHPMLKESGIACDENGFMLVSKTLQSVQFPYIFGAGDCVSFEEYPGLAKNGVYAVRQAPVLFKNIKRFQIGQKLKPFKPKKRYLSILSAGNKKGVLLYGTYSLYGSFPWKIKHWIDRRYMQKMKR
ncbi:NAD(P)/FAD-dependent oxidoreductase [Metabacillus indicus]|uniref:NAD(P)/FAD-dependent oxidoreductase n=1 Tax=Metabacillus indicus TaxID=246786 RepID=UPI0039841CBE